MHQGLALSPLLFMIVMEASVTLLWELLYADDLVVVAENEGDLINRLYLLFPYYFRNILISPACFLTSARTFWQSICDLC